MKFDEVPLLAVLIFVVGGCCSPSRCRPVSDMSPDENAGFLRTSWPDKTDHDGMSVLATAAEAGDAEIVDLLLKRGANPNLPDRWGRTPLKGASLGGHSAVVSLLMAAGADVNATTYTTGRTALSSAAGNDRSETVELLAHGGADLDARDVWGRTALMSAIMLCRDSTPMQLLELHAAQPEFDPNVADDDGDTLLSMAAEKGQIGIVERLLKMGADIDLANNYGQTPLMKTAVIGYAETAKFLIVNGADLQAKDKNGRTVLDIATERRSNKMLDVLSWAISDQRKPKDSR